MPPDAVLGVVLVNILGFALLVARSRVFHTPLSRRMVAHLAWSFALPLAVYGGLIASTVAPYVVPGTTTGGAPGFASDATLAFAAVLWLLLLPGAGFLLTDLFLSHRRDDDGVPMWFDLLLVLCLALASVLNVVASVADIQLFGLASSLDYSIPPPGVSSVAVVVPGLLLVSFAMYLGGTGRRGGWDVWHPRSLSTQVADHLRAPGGAAGALGFTVLHTVVLGIVYVVAVPAYQPAYVSV